MWRKIKAKKQTKSIPRSGREGRSAQTQEAAVSDTKEKGKHGILDAVAGLGSGPVLTRQYRQGHTDVAR